MTQHDDDPFAPKKPAVSFKDKPFGTTYTGTVTGLPTTVQSRDFETGKLDTWDDGNPKMSVVTEVSIGGVEMGLWAPKPSSMFAAFVEAQKRAGVKIAVGGTVTVTYTHDEPNKTNPKLNPAKQYRVDYTPPTPDAFASNGNASDEPPF